MTTQGQIRAVLVFAGVMYTTWLTHVVMDAERLVSFVSDDAFYYLQVADNIVAAEGSSFDTLNQTNGYHPLWMIVLIPARWVFSGLDKLAFLRVVLVVQGLLAAATVALLWRSLRSTVGAAPALLGLVLFSASFFSPVTGLETALVSFGIALAVWLVVSDAPVGWVGLSLVIVSLGRIDFVPVATGLGLAWVWTNLDPAERSTVRSVVVRLAQVFVLPLVAGSAYLLWNRLVFGHFLPVTHAIKTSVDPRFASSIGEVATAYGTRLAFAPVLLVSLAVAARRFRGHGGRLRPIDLVVICLGVGSLAHLGYLVLNVRFGAARWHLIPHGVSYAVATAHAADAVLGRARFVGRDVVQRVALVLLCLVSLVSNGRVVARILDPPDSNPSVQLYRTARWLEGNTPDRAIVGLSDAGIVGYFSGRRVVNLDGLINSFDTLELIKGEGLCRSLDEVWNVQYVASIVPSSNRAGYRALNLDVPSWARTTRLRVDEAGEVFRSKEAGLFTVAVWDYGTVGCSENRPG